MLILAGVTISLTLGDNGILNRSTQASQQYIKSQLKEELQLKITQIEMEKLQQGNKIQEEDLSRLEEIGASLDSTHLPANGEYKNYSFTIDENYQVIVEDILQGNKPIITYTLSSEEIGATDVTITLTAKVEGATITKITKPDGTILENTQTTTYLAKHSGAHVFKVETSQGRKASCAVIIKNIALKEPVITGGEYPMLTSTGVVTNKEVWITYEDNPSLNNYYSLDNGNTWIPYTRDFELTTGTIKAKSVLKVDPSISVETTKQLGTDYPAVEKEAFDNNKSTYFPVVKPYLMKVDSSCWGKYITCYVQTLPSWYQHGAIQFNDRTNTFISGDYLQNLTGESIFNLSAKSVLIPNETRWLMLSTGTSSAQTNFYEIWCTDQNLTGTVY